MPCGGGDVGLNVWVERGELLIYLARSGTCDELNRMPKLGRLRVRIDPNLLDAPDAFRQELCLHEGCVRIEARSGERWMMIEVWVDVDRPVAHVQIDASEPVSLEVTYENWRTRERDFEKPEHPTSRTYAGAPEMGRVRADVVQFADERVQFVHRNAGRTAFDVCVKQQGLSHRQAELWNPLTNLTFGGSVSGANLAPAGMTSGRYGSADFVGHRLTSRERGTSHHAMVVMHVDTTDTLEAWIAGLREIERSAMQARDARERTRAWWAAFWGRSRIVINADRANPTDPAWQIARNYNLFRYQLGCNARGAYPTKFNGGLFTYDPEFVDPKRSLDPDFRAWGGGAFTAQNQRLVYWPMLKSGDVDAMRPQFEFYRRIVPAGQVRAREYFGIDGCFFSEQIEQFGLTVGFDYGWNRPADLHPGVEGTAWICYQWDTVFEFCQMILEARSYAGFDVRPYLPLIEQSLTFFEQYYPADARGHRRFEPSTALETYKNAVNPASVIAALRVVLTSMLELPDELLGAHRARWETMLASLPGFAYRKMNGHRTIAPAESWTHKQNCELPQLYPVYPWRLFGVGKPDLRIAIDTWHHGADAPDQKQIKSWHQDPIFCACLGLTDEAAALTIEKLRDAPRRFPTFWGPGHDWAPDHNWGGSGMIALQEMLLQTTGRTIHLFPAWPREWDVEFKLHAPEQTTIEASLRAGRLERLVVTPESRARDIDLPEWIAR